jgi:hypothetical protein
MAATVLIGVVTDGATRIAGWAVVGAEFEGNVAGVPVGRVTVPSGPRPEGPLA